jgi:hypothetical protein
LAAATKEGTPCLRLFSTSKFSAKGRQSLRGTQPLVLSKKATETRPPADAFSSNATARAGHQP